MINEKIFREYDIRGIAESDLNQESIIRLGHALGYYFKEKNVRTLAIGRDCRVSSSRILSQLTPVLLSSGIDVIDVGLVPTPGLYFSVFELATDAGVMITGSHNPPDFNGLKIALGKGTLYGEEIQRIRHYTIENKKVLGHGKLSSADVSERYLSKMAEQFKTPLPLKVVVDSGNGMGGPFGPSLYKRLGCQVIDLFSDLDGRFPNHHPDPTVLKNLEKLIEKVKQTGAICGIGFDGDADRIGVVDASGRVIYGDELLIIYARSILKNHPKSTVISEVKASYRLFDDVAAHGGTPIMWKTGHSLIKAKMKETSALLAGEMSGHMFFSDRYYGFDDAIYAGARLIEILASEKKTCAELLSDLPTTTATPEIRIDCSDELKFKVVDRATAEFRRMGLEVNSIDGARINYADGWGLVRASNTQPVLVYRFEASTPARLAEIRAEVESVVAKFI